MERNKQKWKTRFVTAVRSLLLHLNCFMHKIIKFSTSWHAFICEPFHSRVRFAAWPKWKKLQEKMAGKLSLGWRAFPKYKFSATASWTRRPHVKLNKFNMRLFFTQERIWLPKTEISILADFCLGRSTDGVLLGCGRNVKIQLGSMARSSHRIHSEIKIPATLRRRR